MCELACQGQDGKFFCPLDRSLRFDSKSEVKCPTNGKVCRAMRQAVYNIGVNKQELQDGRQSAHLSPLPIADGVYRNNRRSKE
jgi:hypothetical protein